MTVSAAPPHTPAHGEPAGPVRAPSPTARAGARRLVDALAVLDRPAGATELRTLAGLTADQFAAARADPVAADVVVGPHQRLSFRSAEDADAARSRLPDPVRVLWHRIVADLPDLPVAERVEHLLAGGRVPDLTPGGELDRALDGVAPADSARLTMKALDVLSDDTDDSVGRARLVVLAVRALCRLGRPEHALALGSALAPGLRGCPETGLALGEAALGAGRAAEAAVGIDAVLAAGAPPHVVRRAAVLRVHAALDLDDPRTALRYAAAVPDGADGAAAARAAAALAHGDVTGARAALRDLTAGAPALGPAPPDWRPAVAVLLADDEMALAARLLASVRSRLDTAAEPWWYLSAAEVRLAAGRLSAAARYARRGLESPGRVPTVALTLHAVATEAAVLLERSDDVARHLGHLRHGRAHGRSGGPRAAWAQALATGAGRGLVAPDEDLEVPRLVAIEPRAPVEIVRAHLVEGRPDRAAVLVTHLDGLAHGRASHSRRAAADHAGGLVRHDIHALRRAAREWSRAGRFLAAAVASRDLAALDDGRGPVPDGSAPERRAAIEGLRDCGADAAARRLERAATGAAADGDAPGWASLTRAERRVVERVVEGGSNREVAATLRLSRHTVDSHLRRAFSKLGVSNRVALAAAAHRYRDPELTWSRDVAGRDPR